MKIYAPKYYKAFKCTADACSHSCCMGWEIDVDADFMRKYAACTAPYAGEILSSIDMSETPHFRLLEDERCPHLDDTGLCRIIRNLGEEYLTDICREHPRFYVDTIRRKEVGIGASCEEACRLILTSDMYDVFEEIGEVPDEPVETEGNFDAGFHRTRIYGILSDDTVLYPKRLEKISSEYGVTPRLLSDDEWREELSGLEYLKAAHKQWFSAYSSDLSTPSEDEKLLERALAYFIFRHCSGAREENEFRLFLGFCLFMERLFSSLIKFGEANTLSDRIKLLRTVSEEIEYSEENTEKIKTVFAFI